MDICLNMIVRNESGNLPRLFASLRGAIDYYVISDTGSTDDTISCIKSLGEKYHIPGIITSHAWVDFAHNRNLALQDARKAAEEGFHSCKWLLFIDADEELVISDNDWKNELVAGKSYSLYKKINGLAFRHLFLIWLKEQQWQWKGAIHNYLVNENKSHERIHLKQVFIQYNESQGAKSKSYKDSREKYQQDIHLLQSELAGKEIREDNVNRFFQLAYAYKNIADFTSAIHYMKQVAAYENTSVQTKYSALVFIAKYLFKEKPGNVDILPYLEQAISLEANRSEAYYYLGCLFRQMREPVKALAVLEKAVLIDLPAKGLIFFEESIYTWKIKYELAFLYFQSGNYKNAQNIIEKLIEFHKLPQLETAFLHSLKVKIDEMLNEKT